MPIFNILTNSPLGVSHSGEVTVSGEDSVHLTDEEVQQLIDLIRENGGETNVEKLNLEERYPEIYERLDEVYHDAASSAAFREWVIEGYECSYFDEPDDFRKAVLEAGLFEYNFEPTAELIEQYREDYGLDEDDEIDQEELEEYLEEEGLDPFYDCVSKYYNSLDEDRRVAFIKRFYAEALEDWDSSGIDYDVKIPPAIIKMAKDGQ